MLEELRRGGTNAEIAVRLGLSPETVKTHVASMLAKLGLADRHELAAWTPPTERDSLGARLALPAAFGSLTRPLLWVGAGAAALAGVAVLVVVLVSVRGDVEHRVQLPPSPSPTPITTPEPAAANQTLEFIVDCRGWASITMEVPQDIAVRMELNPGDRTWVIVDMSGQVVGTLRSTLCAEEANVTFVEPEHSDVAHAIADSYQVSRWEAGWFTAEFDAGESPAWIRMREVPALLAPGQYEFVHWGAGLMLAVPEGVIATTETWGEDEHAGYPGSAWGINFRLVIGNEEAAVAIEWPQQGVTVSASNISEEAMRLVTELVQSIRFFGYF